MGSVDTCRHGHEYTEENTIYRNGIRACRECAKTPRRKKRATGQTAATRVKAMSMAQAARIVVDDLEPISSVARISGHDRKALKGMAWALVSDRVRERDNRQCVWCGTRGERLHVHHRKPKGIGGADAVTEFGMGNLITLCPTHHEETHARPEWSRQAGLIVPSPADPEETPIDTGTKRIEIMHDGRRWDTRNDGGSP